MRIVMSAGAKKDVRNQMGGDVGIGTDDVQGALFLSNDVQRGIVSVFMAPVRGGEPLRWIRSITSMIDICNG